MYNTQNASFSLTKVENAQPNIMRCLGKNPPIVSTSITVIGYQQLRPSPNSECNTEQCQFLNYRTNVPFDLIYVQSYTNKTCG